MLSLAATQKIFGSLPSWVPDAALHYLIHIEAGASIRALARRAGCHASTISRQVRAFETRRDDLLVDDALRRLGRQIQRVARSGSHCEESPPMPDEPSRTQPQVPTEERLAAEAPRLLRRLCEGGAVLAVAPELDTAVVMREIGSTGFNRTATADRALAEAMALKGWISGDGNGRVARYRITPAGRATLNRLLAEAENQALRQTLEPADPSAEEHGTEGESARSARRRVRYGAAESPLALLARRRGRDGLSYLTQEMVQTGERLREDFEMARIDLPAARSWEAFMTEVAQTKSAGQRAPRGEAVARARLVAALIDLGPGLGDVALCCCCCLEGLESAERRLGWSARSGKVVLRIALQRLRRHYDGLGDAGGLIG